MGTPIDPYEKYKVEAIQKDKFAKEEWKRPPEERKDKKSALGAYFLSLFQKFLEFFEDVSEKGLTTSAEREVRKHLFLMKAAFEAMKREDKSQDISFLNHLSELWHQILEDALCFKRATPLAIQYQKFIKEIESYPKESEHTLGYYLTEYAGQAWLPFPFMELIQKIYQQHQTEAESALNLWTHLIDALTEQLS